MILGGRVRPALEAAAAGVRAAGGAALPFPGDVAHEEKCAGSATRRSAPSAPLDV